MANEYLTRTPTSTGNQKVFTYSCWIKRNKLSAWARLLSIMNGSTDAIIQLTNVDKLRFRDEVTGPDIDYISSRPLRDVGSWMHVLVAIDTTAIQAEHRIRMYINGDSLIEHGLDTESMPGDRNLDLQFNDRLEHRFFARNNNSEYFLGEAFDLFWVDGQALTPDVFGFNKDGDGYVSVGSTQATDFRPGQWVPKSPRTIKSEINRRGGFGVNGFYLPMNDSSNFGADFHCDPNTIIKLKGEDLPQPRNGAPTTTDAYVSQLRTDSYAANLVLAVPGIALENTNTELVTNGTFDTNIAGWTGYNSTPTWDSVNQRLAINASTEYDGAETSSGISVSANTNYTLSLDVSLETAGGVRIQVRTSNNSASVNLLDVTTSGRHAVNFDSGANTAVYIRLITSGGNSGTAYFDNVSLKEAVAVRDYSADIKGSGSNKTLTTNGDAGVALVPSYYGSALSLDGTGDVLMAASHADFNLGNGDYTIEGWYYDQETAVNTGSHCFWAIGGVNSDGTLALFYENNALMLRGKDVGQAYENIIYLTNHGTPVKQWNHLCVERVSGRTTLYLNGVALQTTTDTTTIAQGYFTIGAFSSGGSYPYYGYIQDVRVYKGVAKYKGGFDVSKPYTPVGIGTWRQVPDTCKNNFATLNPNILSNPGLTDGNLKIVGAGGWIGWFSTFSFVSGKYYMEMHFPDTTNSNSYYHGFGLKHDGFASNASGEYFGNATGKAAALVKPGSIALYNNGNQGDIATGTYTGSHIMGMAIDADSGKVWWSIDGTWIGANPSTGNSASYTFTAGQTVIPGVTSYNSSVSGDLLTLNFGQNPTFSGTITAGTTYTDSNGRGLFKYQPPTGFLALCEDNLPAPAIADPGEHFKTVLWTGVNHTVKIKCGFQPDFVWIRNRDYTNWHSLYDSIRGPYLELNSNSTQADRDRSSNDGLRSFDSDGFTSGLDDNTGGRPGDSYVAWCWKAGGSAVPNTSGSVTSQVSVNQTAGFSIVSYTGNATGGATVGHGLGTTPSMIIVKSRSLATDWIVQHKSAGTAPSKLMLNNTGAVTNSAPEWNNTLPNSSTFTIGPSGYSVNNSGSPYIAYCWVEIEGYSKFGSYTGNGNANGPFVYCGFKPAWVMVKSSSNSGTNWRIWDSSRSSTNPNNLDLLANTNHIENAHGSDDIDLLSNGFKIRSTGSWHNSSGGTYVFMAFAESPFQTANAK